MVFIRTHNWKVNARALPGDAGACAARRGRRFPAALSRCLLGLWVVASLGWAARASAATCSSPASGLVGWWQAEGNANDIIGANNGSLLGGATAGGAGMVGSAFTFNGTNGYVQIPDAPALKPTNLTIECWVLFTSLDSTGSGGSPAGDQFMVFKQNSRSTSFEGFDLGKTRIGGGDVFEFLVSSSAGASVDLQGTSFISTNVWYHVAGVRGSNFLQLYVNGQRQAQSTISFAQDYGTQPLLFGTSGQASWDHKLKGSLDEVSLYNRALSSNEVVAVYQAGAAGKCLVPVVSAQPQSLTNTIGANVSFNVTASGSAPLAYQWQRSSTNLPNGGNVSGATSSSLALTNIQAGDASDYRVIVTNSYGAVTSAVATLTVTVPTVAQITNLPATVIQAASARLNGQVLDTGGNAPAITFYYGTSDGGTNAGSWAQSVGLGVQAGSYNQTVSGLSSNTLCYFTARAVNSAGTSWATPSRSFTTLAGAPPLQRVPNTTLAMPQNPPSFGYTLTNAFGNLNFMDPVCLASPPGETNRLFVVERGGTVAVITNLANPTRTVFLDISGKVTASLEECGLLSIVFHPGYVSNGFFFVWYYGPDATAAGTGAHDILARYTVSAGNPNSADAASEVKFIRQFDQDQFHNAGDMHFGPDGYLYLTLGDEGGSNSAYNNDQRIDKDLFSGMIRIDVDKKAGSLAPNLNPAVSNYYTIPPDNPFIGYTNFNGSAVNPTNVRTEFWAVGMRNPWRWNFDPPTGRIYLGDVGQLAQEEVDVVVKGGNYGWAFVEGCVAGPKTAPTNFSSIAPIVCYPHGSGANQGYCVIGGPVYRGSQLSQLSGAYIYGDNVSGHLWSLTYDGTSVTSSQTLISGGAVGLSSFGTDPRNGDVLLAIRGVEGSGSPTTTQPIKRLVYSTNVVGQPLPATLNDTGAFSDLPTLTPSAGIIPYDINVPFWSDNAIKSRWFSIPNTNLDITYSPTNNWSFPTGAVWIKHFDLVTNSSPPISTRLETRLLVRNPTGVYGATYRWAGGTNATLVPEGGMDDTFVINNGGTIVTQIWHYPARSECLVCHASVAGLALGLNAPQMHRNMTYSGNTVNQLQALSDAGYFTAAVTDIPSVTPLAAATNSSASLEYRARSYLSANCVHCHQPGGGGLGLWDARFNTPMAQAGLTNGALIDNLGDSNNYVIKLGSLSNSVLLTRVANFGNLHMPPLATSVLNTQAVQLLSAWITNASSSSSAQLVVSPASLNFGLVAVGGTPQATFTLSNPGSTAVTNGVAAVNGGPFTILSGSAFDVPGFGTSNVVVRFSPTNAAGFTNSILFTTGNGGNSTNQLTGSAALSPTASFTGIPTSGLLPLSVSFTNASTGAISNSFWDFGDGATTNTTAATLAHNYAGAGTNTVTLTVSSPLGTNILTRTSYILVTNPPPQLITSPTNLDFGSVVLGQTNTKSFQVINSGGLVLTGSVTTVPPFAIQSGSPYSVASGQTGLVSVIFSPGSASSFSNVVIFSSNAGNRTNAVTGVGLTPAQLAVSPAALGFGLVAVGSNVQASFAVTNQGGAALAGGAVSVSGGPFTILSGTPFNLAGFGTTNVVVRFAPTNTAVFTNLVAFTTGNGGNSTNQLTGSAALPPTASFTGNPTSGLVPLSVSFTNTSTGAISNAVWDFGDGAITNTTALALAHNYAGAGTNTVMLTVSSPLGTNTLTRTNYILVTNLPPQLTLSPTNLDFGSVVLGQTNTQSFQVINSGGLVLTGSVTTVPPFAIPSGSPYSVASGQTGLVSVSFSPASASSFSNIVIFASNGGNRTNALTGAGLTPAQLAVSPPTLGFGLVAVGSNVQASFVVTNQGGAVLSGGAANVNGGPFSILSGTPFNLAGFGSTNVVVRFAPTNAAGFSNIVAFTTGNGGNSTNQLTGSAALPPTASFAGNPTSGLVPLSVSFTNASAGAISNAVWDFGDGVITNTTSLVLAHNYAGAGTNTVTLTVSSPLGTNTLTRTSYILVTNLPPQLTLSPTNLDFGSVVLGQTNTQSFQLVNSGGLVLTGNVVTVPPFAIQSGNPFSLASGQTGLVSVTFSPTNALSFSNVVIFAGNAGNRTNALAGVGLTPARLVVSPATLDLGLVAVGTNVQAAFIVTNQGGAALASGSASLNGGPFTILSGTPFTLSGFGATNLVVRFAPTNTGSFTNTAIFTSGNGGNATNLLTGSAAVAPSADFAANPTTGEWPLSVLFTDLSKGTITNSFWDFGDGATTNTTVSAFSHNYPGMGTNTVSLTVSGPLGTDTVTRPNYIVITNVPPVTLSILLVSNQVQLIWREGMLQYATGPTDTYTNLPEAISPYTITPAEATLFFRVKVR